MCSIILILNVNNAVGESSQNAVLLSAKLHYKEKALMYLNEHHASQLVPFRIDGKIKFRFSI